MIYFKKKTDYDAKVSDIKKRYFTTYEYNKFTNDIFDVKIAGKKIVNGFDFADFVTKTYFDAKL